MNMSNTSFQEQEAVTDAPINDVLAINQIEKILIGGFEDILKKPLTRQTLGRIERMTVKKEKDNDQVDILAGHEFEFESLKTRVLRMDLIILLLFKPQSTIKLILNPEI
ncbi:hypothetical protein BCR41DRAFT_390989 [Lobosporangium transversale]|uniref:Uncharacterized protein n=1 Tax=Lobosporangium transversale TaxID=64571 RepID=A0A1Y2G0B9_9FUNG|nr:hypothetical protein BCR41DRAFT_390989 [Lobosporangium transversale]ORY89844.1 hypothetical protein BCR41DRAFT_390989 [Lobosporangium transversale]|eukprot:XP_021875076.1 hypothetical protein BCR41DRAFT_390989 [Lobosporangium transversale]